MFTDKKAYGIGEVVRKKLTGEKVLILRHLDNDSEDDEALGNKYLVRTEDHKKIVIHEIELKRVEPFNTAALDARSR